MNALIPGTASYFQDLARINIVLSSMEHTLWSSCMLDSFLR